MTAEVAETAGLGVSCRGLVYIYRLEGYDVVALAGVDLDISPGESVALLGPSGSGKSTLLAVLAGLLAPSAGRLIVGERDMTRATAAELAQMRAGNVGVVLQGTSRNLLPYLSAEQNVRFAQRGAAGRRNSRLPAAREVLSLVGLSGRGRGKMRPQQLTPGERQRLALAVALSNGPGLLLADEPTSQLDSRARDEVIAALESVRQAGTTVVLVTHDPTVGEQMGRTITIRDGRVGAEGRRGEDYAVVGRDGSIHLPPDVLQVFPTGTLVEVLLDMDGTARLVTAGDPAAAGYRRVSAASSSARPASATSASTASAAMASASARSASTRSSSAEPKPAPVAEPANRQAAKSGSRSATAQPATPARTGRERVAAEPVVPVVPQPVAPKPVPAPSPFFDPQYAEPQYAEPQYAEPQYPEPQYPEPQYPEPQYADVEYVEPQYADARYAETPYVEPQYAQAAYIEAEYVAAPPVEAGYVEASYRDAPYVEAQFVEEPPSPPTGGQSRSGLADLLRKDHGSTEPFDYWGEG